MRLEDTLPDPAPAVISRLDRLKSAWEKLAVVSALAYALGYVARAIHAWDYNFGALPGARFDYLIAGIFLAVPVAALAGLLAGLYKATGLLHGWAGTHPQQAGRWRHRVLFPLLLAAITYLVSQDALGFLSAEARRVGAGVSLFVFVAAAVLTGVLQADDTAGGEDRSAARGLTVVRWLGGVYAHLVTAYFGLLAALAFGVAALLGAGWLDRWPQELGGVKAKCGVLDLATEKLSPELLGFLAPLPADAASAPKVVRSHPLEVYSTTGPWLIRSADPSASTPGRRSIRLPNDAVLSVEWVGLATPRPAGARPCPAR